MPEFLLFTRPRIKDTDRRKKRNFNYFYFVNVNNLVPLFSKEIFERTREKVSPCFFPYILSLRFKTRRIFFIHKPIVSSSLSSLHSNIIYWKENCQRRQRRTKETERKIKINVCEFFHILIFSFLLLTLFKRWLSTLYASSFDEQVEFLVEEYLNAREKENDETKHTTQEPSRSGQQECRALFSSRMHFVERNRWTGKFIRSSETFFWHPTLFLRCDAKSLSLLDPLFMQN